MSGLTTTERALLKSEFDGYTEYADIVTFIESSAHYSDVLHNSGPLGLKSSA